MPAALPDSGSLNRRTVHYAAKSDKKQLGKGNKEPKILTSPPDFQDSSLINIQGLHQYNLQPIEPTPQNILRKSCGPNSTRQTNAMKGFGFWLILVKI